MSAIYRRELLAYFTSPIAYVFIAVFTFFSGMYFSVINLGYGYSDMSNVFAQMFMIIMFLIPILTMRLLSEERRQKTDQCLLTSPVSLTSIVVGKYLAALTVYIAAIAVFFIYAAILSVFIELQWLTILGSITGLFLVGAAFIAAGVFASCLTENQVVAAILGFLIIMFLYMIDILASSVNNGTLQGIMMDLSFYERYYEFTTGIFNFSSVLFFVSAVVLFNFFTIRVMERRRWA